MGLRHSRRPPSSHSDNDDTTYVSDPPLSLSSVGCHSQRTLRTPRRTISDSSLLDDGILIFGGVGHVAVLSVSRKHNISGTSLLLPVLRSWQMLTYSDIQAISLINDSVVSILCPKDNKLHFYDIMDNTLLGSVSLVEAGMSNRMAYLSSNRLLVGLSSDKRSFHCLKVNSDDLSQSYIDGKIGETGNFVTCLRSRENVQAVRDQVLVGLIDGNAEIWDVCSRRRIVGFDAHSSSLSAIDVSRNGDYLVTASETLRLWDSRTFLEQSIVDVRERVTSLHCAQMRDDSFTIIVGGVVNTFVLDTRKLGEVVKRWQCGRDVIELDSNRIACTEDRSIRNYEGDILSKWDLRSLVTCYVPPYHSQRTEAELKERESFLLGLFATLHAGVTVTFLTVELRCWSWIVLNVNS